MSDGAALEHDPSVHVALTEALSQLAAARTTAPPNQPIPDYSSAEPEKLRVHAERLTAAGRDVLVYEASEILESLPLPVVSSETPNVEHLAIYHRVSEIRRAVQALRDAALAAGYRSSLEIAVPTYLVAQELKDMKSALAELSDEFRAFRAETQKPDIRGASISLLGLVSFDMKSLMALHAALKKHFARAQENVDAGLIWATSRELNRIADVMLCRVKEAQVEWSAAALSALVEIVRLSEDVAQTSRILLAKAIAYQQRIAQGMGSRGRARYRYTAYNLAVDFGSANARMFLRGKGIILHEPFLITYRATRSGDKSTILAGIESKMAVGRTPPDVMTIAPLVGGGVAHPEAMKELVRRLLTKVGYSRRLMGPPLLTTVPASYGAFERKFFAEIVDAAGGGEPQFVAAPLAAALGAGIDISKPDASLLLSIGAGLTEAAVISLGEIVTSHSAKVGGIQMDEALIVAVRQQCDHKIDLTTAERIKKELYGSGERPWSRPLRVAAKSVPNAMPSHFHVTEAQVRAAIAPTIAEIAEVAVVALARTPPALQQTLQEIVITGGGALTDGLASAVRTRTGLPTRLADDPLSSTILGCGHIMESSLIQNLWREHADT